MENRGFFKVILASLVLLVLALSAEAASLSARSNQIWHQDSLDILGIAEEDDEFGSILAWGDFNGDGYADLAVGIPDEAIGSVNYAGAVNVLYGSESGLSATGNQFWHQNSPDIQDTADGADHFGAALAAGDFNGDGHADLAVGVPYEAIGTVWEAGAVNILYGSDATGLIAAGNQLWHQDRPGVVCLGARIRMPWRRARWF
jgi:hypothetical protein